MIRARGRTLESTQPNREESLNRLHHLRDQIDRGLERYLQVTGAERSQLIIQLMRLRWEAEELEAATQTIAS